MLSRSIIIAIVLGSMLIGGSVVAGVILSRPTHTEATYYDNPDDFLPQDTPYVFGNSTEINTEQITEVNGGVFVSNITGPTISPDYVDRNITSDTIHVPIWWDEFDGDSVNKEHWTIINWPPRTTNDEIQTYNEDQVAVYDGAMHIMAARDGDKWFSGRVESKGAWTPGMVLKDKVVTKIYFESNILIPDSGNGLWPAFWFFPKDYVYGEFSASGEFDVMEMRDGYESITSGVHYGGQKKNTSGIRNMRNMTRTSNVDKTSFANKSFVFGVEWTLDTIVFLMNGVEMTRRHSKAVDPENGWFSAASNAAVSSPFDIPFKAIYNIAVGGNFPKFAPDETTPDEVIMSVDYFRVFADFA